MLKYKIHLMMLAIVIVLSATSTIRADTWRLGEDQDWQAVSVEGGDKFLLAVAETKKLINTGQDQAAAQAFEKLKKDFPEIAGPDLDIFIKAEMLFCKGNFVEAVDDYDRLLTKYPESKLRNAALDRQFGIAMAFLGGQKMTTLGIFEVAGYSEGMKIMEKIGKQAPDTAVGTEATVAMAQKYEEKGQYTKALRIYEKLLTEQPNSDFRDQVMDRQYAIATAYLGGQEKQIFRVLKLKGYAEGVRIMEKITDRAGLDSKMGLDASMAVAEYYERKEDFNSAYLKWWEISSQYQTGTIGRDALFNMARCKHAAYNKQTESKRAYYDSSSLSIAKSCYERFKLLYPGDPEQKNVEKKIEEINEQLAYKQFSIGQYYHRTGNMKSANLYFNMVMNDWPGTKAAEKAKEMLAGNSGDNERENEKTKS
ncbi:MAG: tetratricopeptide repeat protein [Sedimentisphaerales bacterium]|nr:tetratricopeptide repeat protein [Sedimentisphaerales bacterium]